MKAREILAEGVQKISENPHLLTTRNVMNLRIAASLAWQEEEIGGLEHLQFAYRNGTPIVPPGHVGHPVELVKRGFIDGHGWKKQEEPKIDLFKWPDGNHWYASVDGTEVNEFLGLSEIKKWNSAQDAEDAAKRFIARRATRPMN